MILLRTVAMIALAVALILSPMLLVVTFLLNLTVHRKVQAMHAAEKAGFLPWTRNPAAFDLEAYQHYEQVVCPPSFTTTGARILFNSCSILSDRETKILQPSSPLR